MRAYKFFWDAHKWTGIVLAVVILNLAGTGFLLLMKKDYDWIQPHTRTGADGGLESFITIQELFEVVLAQGHEDFQSLADIDRVDFRPGERIYKVRSRTHHAEIQVDAVTGEVLSVDWRPSDLIERIHDGSFYAEWLHDWFMPLVAVSLVFMVGSGLFIWLWPIYNKRRRRRERELKMARKAAIEPHDAPEGEAAAVDC